MPFKSKKQLKKCFALKAAGKAGSWDCDEWAGKTKSIKKLPERKKTAAFSKIYMELIEKHAKALFDSKRHPVIKTEILEARQTSESVTDMVAKRARNVEKKRGVGIKKTAAAVPKIPDLQTEFKNAKERSKRSYEVKTPKVKKIPQTETKSYTKYPY